MFTDDVYELFTVHTSENTAAEWSLTMVLLNEPNPDVGGDYLYVSDVVYQGQRSFYYKLYDGDMIGAHHYSGTGKLLWVTIHINHQNSTHAVEMYFALVVTTSANATVTATFGDFYRP